MKSSDRWRQTDRQTDRQIDRQTDRQTANREIKRGETRYQCMNKIKREQQRNIEVWRLTNRGRIKGPQRQPL